MMRYVFLIAFFLYSLAVLGQLPEKELKKALKADRIEMDQGNGDGVFKARSATTKKWGMYQWMYEGTKTVELVPMQYDSLRYFPFNGNFTAVYNNGKVGFYLAQWSYDDKAKQTVACKYDDYQRYSIKGVTYLAVKKDKKWAWVDWLTGEEKTAFAYDTKKDLPYPDYQQETWFD